MFWQTWAIPLLSWGKTLGEQLSPGKVAMQTENSHENIPKTTWPSDINTAGRDLIDPA